MGARRRRNGRGKQPQPTAHAPRSHRCGAEPQRGSAATRRTLACRPAVTRRRRHTRTRRPAGDGAARLRNVGRLLLEREGDVAVLAARATTADDEARAIAQTASRFLRATARLIRVRFAGRVLIDVTSSRRGMPVTMVAATEPHTLVHIPQPRYS